MKYDNKKDDIAITSTTIVSFAALGEKGGWRGYMMPKLIKLIGMPKAIIFGGIIWGVWHGPLTVSGHNFGTDYPGFPYVERNNAFHFCLDIYRLSIYNIGNLYID